MRLVRRAVLAALAVAIGGGAVAQEQRELGPGHLPPIARDYKNQIAAWSRVFFADPKAIRDVLASDPVLIRDGTGRLMWLVCVQADNTYPYASQPQPNRYAFGFAPNYFSAPNERRFSTLTRDDCDLRSLTWRPFRTASRRHSR